MLTFFKKSAIRETRALVAVSDLSNKICKLSLSLQEPCVRFQGNPQLKVEKQLLKETTNLNFLL